MPTQSSLFLAALAILLWGTFAALSAQLAGLPRFFVMGVALILGSIWSIRNIACLWRNPRPVLFGVCGIFGYHALLFFSFAHAPVVEANLINYLWPFFIVLFSGLFLPGFQLEARHWSGVVLGFLGVLLLLAPRGMGFSFEYAWGYLLAFLAALTWGLFSVFTKKLPDFKARDLGLGCLISGVLALGIHFSAETFVMPTSTQVRVLVLLGIGPMGVAFYAWDRALKLGDPRVIGTLSFFTPLISTLVLAWVDVGTQLHARTIATLLLILIGAFLVRTRSGRT